MCENHSKLATIPGNYLLHQESCERWFEQKGRDWQSDGTCKECKLLGSTSSASWKSCLIFPGLPWLASNKAHACAATTWWGRQDNLSVHHSYFNLLQVHFQNIIMSVHVMKLPPHSRHYQDIGFAELWANTWKHSKVLLQHAPRIGVSFLELHA